MTPVLPLASQTTSAMWNTIIVAHNLPIRHPLGVNLMIRLDSQIILSGKCRWSYIFFQLFLSNRFIKGFMTRHQPKCDDNAGVRGCIFCCLISFLLQYHVLILFIFGCMKWQTKIMSCVYIIVMPAASWQQMDLDGLKKRWLISFA